jgi:hypothetical protein
MKGEHLPAHVGVWNVKFDVALNAQLNRLTDFSLM